MSTLFSNESTFNLSKLKTFLDSLESDVTDIHLYINSGGGSVNEGWAIYDKLRTIPQKVTTIGEGIVGSIATVIYMAGVDRKLHENTKFFIHNPYWQPNADSAMEANDLISLGEDLKNEQAKILSFYSSQTGVDVSKIEPLMNKATDLTSEQAIQLGFANEIIMASVNYKKYQLVAMLDTQTNKQLNYKKMEKSIMAKLNSFGKMIAKVGKGKFYDMDIAATDNAGNPVNLYIESETEDISGKSVYIMDAEGNQIVAPDGEYVDANGKKINVKGGLVADVSANVEEEAKAEEVTIEDLQARLQAAVSENENLKAEKETLKASIEASKSENEEMKANVEKISNEFQALKSTVLGAGQKFETGKQEFNNSKKPVVDTKNMAFLNELASQFKKNN